MDPFEEVLDDEERAPERALELREAVLSVPREKAAPGKGLRRFIFTLHNYAVDTDTLLPSIVGLLKAEPKVRGFVVGEEICPETGVPHLQGYFETANQHTFTALRKWPCFLNCQPWIQGANGSALENEKYCKKEGSWYEGGEFAHAKESFRKGQGQRNDWLIVHELAKSQAPVSEFTERVPHLAYPHSNKISSWRQIHAPVAVRSWNTVPVVCIGPPRAGKSTWIKSRAQELAAANKWRIYTKSDAEKWWPGYDGQEIILIDEMNGSFFDWSRLKRFFDNGEFTVDIKNQPQAQFIGRFVFMTCNEDAHPQVWYPKAKGAERWDDSNALRARLLEFGEVWHFRARERDPVSQEWIFHPPVRDVVLDPVQVPLSPRRLADLDDRRQHF